MQAVGFVFSKDRKQLLLMSNQIATWPTDKLFGFSTALKVNNDKEPIENVGNAMIRACANTIGVKTAIEDWCRFFIVTLTESNITMYCHVAFLDFDSIDLSDCKVIEVADIMQENIVPDIRWLILLALEPDLDKTSMNFIKIHR